MKLIAVKKFYDETIELAKKKEEDYKRWELEVEKEKKEKEAIIQKQAKELESASDALNKTKDILAKVGIPVNTSMPVADNIVLTDIEKIKALIEVYKNIQYPKLTENVEYLNKTLSNTIALTYKIIQYVEERLNKIK